MPTTVHPANGWRPSPLVHAILLAVASGSAALMHQLLWTRRMVDLLGASPESTVRVFAGFFLGLAIGSAWGGWLAKRVRNAWRTLAIAELGCALLVIPVVTLPWWTADLWLFLGPEGLQGLAGQLVKLILPTMVVTPPAILMGVFLPLLGRCVFHGRERLGRAGLWIYGANIFGGVAGILFAVWFLLPAFGAMGTMLLTIGINLLVAAGCIIGGVWVPGFGSSTAEAPSGRPLDYIHNATANGTARWGDGHAQDRRGLKADASGRRGKWLALAFLSGFAVLAAETALFPMLLLVAPLSYYAFSGLLVAALLALGAAAWITPLMVRRLGGVEPLLTPVLVLSAFTCALTPWLFVVFGQAGWSLFEAAHFGGFLWQLLLFSMAVAGPLFLVCGALFPLVSAGWDEVAEDPRGRDWGMLLAINGLGGFLGAELGYRVLLPLFGLYGTLVSVGMIYALAALALLRGKGARRRTPLRFAMVMVVWLAMVAMAIPAKQLPVVNPHLPLRVLHAEAGRDGSLAIVEGEGMGRAMLLYNQYMLGSTGAWAEQERLGSFPMLLHPSPQEVGFIGLATGITPGAALNHEAVNRVTVIEISPMIKRAARDWFADFHNGILSSPRARVIVEDGRTFFAAHSETFDVIVGDLFLPWGPGEARLYSLEHFNGVRRALQSGGLFLQWLPMHQLTQSQLDIILSTFLESFGQVELFCAGFDTRQPLLGLAGWKSPGRLDASIIEARVHAESVWMPDPLMRHPEGVSLLYLGGLCREAQWANARVNHLDNLILELNAGRRRVLASPSEPYLTGEHWLELRRQFREHNRLKLSDQDFTAAVGAACELTNINLRAQTRPHHLRAYSQEAGHWVPRSIMHDTGADWSRWPGIPPR